MKKKIKDLTQEEINKICLGSDECELCPLYVDLNLYMSLCFRNVEQKEILEREVEIDE